MEKNIINFYLSNLGFYFLVKDLQKFTHINKIKTKLTIKKNIRIGNRYKTVERYLYKIYNISGTSIFIIAKNSLDIVYNVINSNNKNSNNKINIHVIDKLIDSDIIENNKLSDGIILDSNQSIISKYLNKNLFINDITTLKHNKLINNAVLVMNTGLGKTYVAAYKIKKVKRKTLIIVPSKNILEEWVKAFSYYTTLNIGCYYSDKKQDGDVVIMTVQSAMSDVFTFKNNSKNKDTDKTISSIKYYEYFNKFGFCIYDEIHSYTSAKREMIFWRINTKYTLGLTATPDENAMKMDVIFEKHCGDLLYADSIQDFNPESVKWSGEVYPIKYYGLPKNTEKLINNATGWTSHGLMVKQFIADENRNNIIINLIKELYDKQRNIFVFFELREYAFYLSKKIKESLQLNEEVNNELSILMGGSNKNDIDNSSNKSKIILTTYGWGYQGLSIPKMDTIIFATPRKAKMIQIIGRILRKSGDSSITRHIYDIIDSNTDIGRNQYNHRKNIYLDKTFYDFNIMKSITYKIQESNK